MPILEIAAKAEVVTTETVRDIIETLGAQGKIRFKNHEAIEKYTDFHENFLKKTTEPEIDVSGNIYYSQADYEHMKSNYDQLLAFMKMLGNDRKIIEATLEKAMNDNDLKIKEYRSEIATMQKILARVEDDFSTQTELVNKQAQVLEKMTSEKAELDDIVQKQSTMLDIAVNTATKLQKSNKALEETIAKQSTIIEEQSTIIEGQITKINNVQGTHKVLKMIIEGQDATIEEFKTANQNLQTAFEGAKSLSNYYSDAYFEAFDGWRHSNETCNAKIETLKSHMANTLEIASGFMNNKTLLTPAIKSALTSLKSAGQSYNLLAIQKHLQEQGKNELELLQFKIGKPENAYKKPVLETQQKDAQDKFNKAVSDAQHLDEWIKNSGIDALSNLIYANGMLSDASRFDGSWSKTINEAENAIDTIELMELKVDVDTNH